MERVKTVIVGMGKMGKIRYDRIIKHGGFDIVGICDNNPKNLEGYAEKAFLDWEKCIDDTKPEAVFVSAYNVVIPEIVCYALRKNKHVFSEKPPGRTLQDTERMYKASKERPQSILKFGFNHRYHNSIMEAKALIDSGIIGDVVCARGVYGKAGSPSFADEWRNDTRKSGGGILLDQGIHMLDLLRYFLGDFSRVKSSVDTLVWKQLDTEDSAFAILETESGKLASLHSSALQWRHKFDLDIICTNGYIALNGLLTSTRSYGEERMTYYRKDLYAKTGNLGRPMEHTFYFNEDFSWDYEISEFYDAIVNGKKIRQGTIEDAVKVMELIEKIYRN